jgi:hypothetical protein
MDIFVRLLQGDARDDGPGVALDALEAIATSAARDPEAARAQLRRAGRRHDARFAIGGELHDVYRAAYEALHERVSASSDQVHVVLCRALAPAPTLRALQRSVRRVAAPIVVVRAEARTAAGAAGELEALALLADDASLDAVVIGERDVLLRRSLLDGLLLSERVLAPDAVAGALVEAMRDAGATVRSVAP